MSNNVGILAMEVYFPSTYVKQEELEKANNVSKGKYTIGLGQISMAFTGDHEDINSICLTVVKSLLEKYDISPNDIGRIEVGTETLIDKSKSTKTVLMSLFSDSGNTDIEGATVVNACYGGTSALLNALVWADSSSWDGRYAIVVAGDIAVYADGPARPTGGCGSVAMLIGRNAPLAIDLYSRVTHATNVWDFFKPNMESEYPYVDGALSQTCFLKAIDDCYTRFVLKYENKHGVELNVETIDHFLFHSPYNKLVQKSFARLLYHDMKLNKRPIVEGMEKFFTMDVEKTYEDKELETKLKEVAGSLYKVKVAPACKLSQEIGNTYTASVYLNLANLVSYYGVGLENKTVVLFSYGSGALASMLAIKPTPSSELANSKFSLQSIQAALNLSHRLSQREELSPSDLDVALKTREQSHGVIPFKPSYNIERAFPGTFYIESINLKQERKYVRKSLNEPQIRGGVLFHSPDSTDIESSPQSHSKPVNGTDKNEISLATQSSVSNESNNLILDEPVELSQSIDNLDREVTPDRSILSASSANTTADEDSNQTLSLLSKVSIKSVNGSSIVPSVDNSTDKSIYSSINSSISPIRRNETYVWPSGRPNIQVVITGVAAAVPGGRLGLSTQSEGISNIHRIISGENFISSIPHDIQDIMLEKKVCELRKDENSKLNKYYLTKYEETINLCASLGEIDLVSYGVSESIVNTMDKAVQVAVAAGLEALKDAGIVTGVGEGTSGWVLPKSMQQSTGIVYATSFPALDTAIGEVTKYFSAKLTENQNVSEIISMLRQRLMKALDIDPSNKAGLSADVNAALASIESLGKEISEKDLKDEKEVYEFDRKFLFRVLVLGNAQLAQIIKAKGPNMQTNAACAGSTQAIAVAYDLIQVGRAERMIVIAGDNASSDTLLPWLGNGFRALGAATTCADVKLAALPFDARRSGMILGSGGIAMVLESEEGASRRYSIAKTFLGQTRAAAFKCRLIGTLFSNSAYHGAAIDKNHVAEEFERFIHDIEKEHGISRQEIARHGVYFSHETSTHASNDSSCAANEVFALRRVFGEDVKHLVILNTKGFTGHPMGVSFEDVVAVEVLTTGLVPPIANNAQLDPYLGTDLKLSRGGEYNAKYAIRFSAGFGSQIAIALYGRNDVVSYSTLTV